MSFMCFWGGRGLCIAMVPLPSSSIFPFLVHSLLSSLASLLTFLTQDPNQLIRASALRVLSSIRVPIIAPIMMLSIKEVCKIGLPLDSNLVPMVLASSLAMEGLCLDLHIFLSLSLLHTHVWFQSVTDMSPYVRKTAAHAIPKLYRYGRGKQAAL